MRMLRLRKLPKCREPNHRGRNCYETSCSTYNHPSTVCIAFLQGALLQEITTPEDFTLFSPEGGCQTPCNVRLDCGHTCEKPCHALDAEHAEARCTKPCGRTCPSAYEHPCKGLCYQVGIDTEVLRTEY